MSELGYAFIVKRNDQIALSEITELNPSHIILSPGPKSPDQAGICLAVIKAFGDKIPILGVCLGHQAIGPAYGGRVVRALHPMHGKASLMIHNEKTIFKGLSNPLRIGRYHSLIVSNEFLPQELEVIARCDQGEVMALKVKNYPVFGVQFHPESILTEHGYRLLQNFFNANFG